MRWKLHLTNTVKYDLHDFSYWVMQKLILLLHLTLMYLNDNLCMFLLTQGYTLQYLTFLKGNYNPKGCYLKVEQNMTRKLLKKLSASGNKLNLLRISENRLKRAKHIFSR